MADTDMTIVEQLKTDYARFPYDQTYDLYAQDVYFKDLMTQFRGIDRYQKMIGFIQTWFINCHMDLHDIQQHGNQIRSDWTLSWNTPLPWKPQIAISGWSELTLNDAGLIVSHIDYWHCSRLDVLKQHFFK
ncbi:DUF2358 domain-containing protein [Pantanalinema rosaneae CENA516]|uniref:DUF2358 domain-containing protein n=1 Tax=Pantanalinema rosaneae TaxID=1620701 RepID=UPI003D6F9969